jgi:uncharacterized protein YbaA (DUF1428 family)
MAYMEMFVGPVLTSKRDAYSAYAKEMGSLTMKAGALSVTACWGDDSPGGMLKALASAVKVEPGETLVARIVRWTSKSARDEGWANMMKTPDMQTAPIEMPFDRARVCHAGFEEIGDE